MSPPTEKQILRSSGEVHFCQAFLRLNVDFDHALFTGQTIDIKNELIKASADLQRLFFPTPQPIHHDGFTEDPPIFFRRKLFEDAPVVF